MNLAKTMALLATLATILGATYLHDRAHRYDIVAAGAGSGGTQNDAGQTDFRAFIIDHQTGKVWMFRLGTPGVFVGMPLTRLPCSTVKNAKPFSDFGCSDSAAEESARGSER
jgi:hypothetical protein